MTADPFLDLPFNDVEPDDEYVGRKVNLWPTVAAPGTVPVELIAARRTADAPDGARLLDDVETFLARFVSTPVSPSGSRTSCGSLTRGSWTPGSRRRVSPS